MAKMTLSGVYDRSRKPARAMEDARVDRMTHKPIGAGAYDPRLAGTNPMLRPRLIRAKSRTKAATTASVLLTTGAVRGLPFGANAVKASIPYVPQTRAAKTMDSV